MDDTREDAIRELFETSEVGDIIEICRSDRNECQSLDVCPMCARVLIQFGMTLQDVLALSRPYRV